MVMSDKGFKELVERLRKYPSQGNKETYPVKKFGREETLEENIRRTAKDKFREKRLDEGEVDRTLERLKQNPYLDLLLQKPYEND
jgi:hypothetical protein